MTLILSPQLESRLVREAQRHGLSPDAYAEQLLGTLLFNFPIGEDNSESTENNVPRFGSAKGKVTIPDDFDEPLDDFLEYVPLPPVPDGRMHLAA